MQGTLPASCLRWKLGFQSGSPVGRPSCQPVDFTSRRSWWTQPGWGPAAGVCRFFPVLSARATLQLCMTGRGLEVFLSHWTSTFYSLSVGFQKGRDRLAHFISHISPCVLKGCPVFHGIHESQLIQLASFITGRILRLFGSGYYK